MGKKGKGKPKDVKVKKDVESFGGPWKLSTSIWFVNISIAPRRLSPLLEEYRKSVLRSALHESDHLPFFKHFLGTQCCKAGIKLASTVL